MENLKNIWKPECKLFAISFQTTEKYEYLCVIICISLVYRIQLEAPKPKRVVCDKSDDRPEFYGREYHGVMSHKEATSVLENEPNGAFLIRKGSQGNDFYTLTLK